MTEYEIKVKRESAQEISEIITSLPEDERKDLLNIIIGYKLGAEARAMLDKETT